MKKIIFLNLFMIFQISISNTSLAAVKPPKNPKSAKGCAICHFRWIDTFFIEGQGSDLVEYHSEKVVATPEMCFSCHDGSVKDSRARLNNDYGHKTNMPPPANMKIPEIFPLDEDGKVQCATCHTAHGVPSGEAAETTIFMRISNKYSGMCRMCHPEKSGGIKTGNHPVNTSKQPIVQKLIARGAITGGDKNQFICETCHTAHGSPYESLLLDSAGDSALCLDCHGDKSAFKPDGQKESNHIINTIPQKGRIPEALIKKGARLGYNGVITCLTCHKIHNNEIEPRKLLIGKNEKSSLCLTCHHDKRLLANTKHNLMHSAPKEKNLEGKTAEESGVCSACHLPHKAARKVNAENNFSAPLCMSCHNETSIAKNKVIKNHSHPINISPFEKGMTTTLPLIVTNATDPKKGIMTCHTCHDPHRRAPLKTMTGSHYDSEGDTQNSFLRLENSPAPKLCENCHPDKAYIEKTDHDLMVTAPFSKNIINQTPVESGVCGVCHLAHNGKNPTMLWARNFGSGSNIMEMMCNSCHSGNGPAKNKSPEISSHPKDKLIINAGRNIKGRLNFFPIFHETSGKLLSVGNISCPSCHNAHQWNSRRPVKGTGRNVEGNATNSFLRTQALRVLCIDCHGLEALLKIKYFHDPTKRTNKKEEVLLK